jgi:hypothetical protein
MFEFMLHLCHSHDCVACVDFMHWCELVDLLRTSDEVFEITFLTIERACCAPALLFHLA